MTAGEDGPARLARRLRWQAEACERLGCPLYARVLERAAADVAAGGPVRDLLRGREDEPGRLALALRLLAAVHRLVLTGRLPRLAPYYASVGGTLPPEGAWEPFRDALLEHGELVRAQLDLPVQTNEVGRCAALMPGFHEVVGRTGLPLRLLEVGASGGLNLHWDRYRYETPGGGWGDPASPLVLRDRWLTPVPLRPALTVAERLGCDPAPIDATRPEGALALRAFVWPSMRERLAVLDAALEVARAFPLAVEAADGGEWLERRLGDRPEGTADVVFHAVVMQYPAPASLARMGAALQRAAGAATASRPLAWLRFEPAGDRFELRLSLWPGGDDRLLATSAAHGTGVRWLG